MKRCLVFVVLLCVAVTVCHAEDRWALLVGIDRYANRMIAPLTGAVNDVKALRKVLVE